MSFDQLVIYAIIGVVTFLLLYILRKSIIIIGPMEVGLVRKQLGAEPTDIIALNGESGYQGRLRRSGLHMIFPFLYTIERWPLVQVETDEVGLVISQVGAPLPPGSRSGIYKPEFRVFEDVREFLNGGGQKGVQRMVLQPGTVAAIHPVAFLVVTSKRIYGMQVDQSGTKQKGHLTHEMFGLEAKQLKRIIVPPGQIGIVETLDGPALESDQVAGRIGGFDDIRDKEAELRGDSSFTELSEEEARALLASMAGPLMDLVLARRLDTHHSYQDFQAFLAAGGRMGVQHDVLSPGSYNLNPLLVSLRNVPMLSVDQSEVAVIRSAVGLALEDVSGAAFKFGALTLPGHRGLLVAGLRTGLYPINPEIYTALMVPTNVITLSWAQGSTAAQALDRELSPIQGTSKDGFTFTLELQVQVHVPADQAPHLISLVGQMEQLVNGILQPVVGAFFRDALQARTATQFIVQRDDIRTAAEAAIKTALAAYFVEVQGVFIQAVHYPDQIAEVLRKREIATQQTVTYGQEQIAEQARINVEATRGRADAQAQLAQAEIGVGIAKHKANAAKAEAEGQAAVTTTLAEADATSTRAAGDAEADAIKAAALARAAGYEAQRAAIGPEQTALVAILHEIGVGSIKVTPDVLVAGSGADSSAGLMGLVTADLLRRVKTNGGLSEPANDSAPVTTSSTS